MKKKKIDLLFHHWIQSISAFQIRHDYNLMHHYLLHLTCFPAVQHAKYKITFISSFFFFSIEFEHFFVAVNFDWGNEFNANVASIIKQWLQWTFYPSNYLLAFNEMFWNFCKCFVFLLKMQESRNTVKMPSKFSYFDYTADCILLLK